MAVEEQEDSEYLWDYRDGSTHEISRKLTATERMFAVLNETLFGQNCPFLGATILFKQENLPSAQPNFTFEDLRKRAVIASCQTRWKYPTIAAQLVGNDTASYSVESKENIEKWAERTTKIRKQDETYLTLREKLSRTSPLPTENGDCCIFYLIVRPDVAALPKLTTFDILIHMHHAFIDGSGIRSILNEFLERLADPLPLMDITWGYEIDRLYPPSILLENGDIKGRMYGQMDLATAKDILNSQLEPDHGLPLYRPDILQPNPKHRGSLLVRHTFEDPDFLAHALSEGRKHGVKLTALLQTALMQAVYNLADVKLPSKEAYHNNIPVDLRTNTISSPYNGRNVYVNSAVAVENIKILGELFECSNFWSIATNLGNQWKTIKDRGSSGKNSEQLASLFLDGMKSQANSSSATPMAPRTCPYYVSDPSGSQQLSASYPVSGLEGLQLVLESYQLATDQSQAVVSARSHSWNGRLTLCLVFNATRNPRDKMQEFLNEWIRVLQDAL